jgi:anti-sigma regulatory factor (Ser/Thr protein kinase)
MPTYRRTFPGRPEEIRKARDWARAVLVSSPHADDAALVVTELGTNAVLHTASGQEAGTFQVWLTHFSEHVTVSVADRGGTNHPPGIEQAAQDATSGRGLTLVTAVAHHIEIYGDEHGRTVSAHLIRTPAQPVSTH